MLWTGCSISGLTLLSNLLWGADSSSALGGYLRTTLSRVATRWSRYLLETEGDYYLYSVCLTL